MQTIFEWAQPFAIFRRAKDVSPVNIEAMHRRRSCSIRQD